MAAAASYVLDIPMECRSIEDLKKIRAKSDSTLKYPDFTNMPTPAFLVVGSSPFEPHKGRDYYDDEHYYMIDTVGEISPDQRHIKADITNTSMMNPISIVFCKKFDVIIFDHSVAKFIIKNHTAKLVIQYLIKMLKPGGIIIVDAVLPNFGVNEKIEKTREYYELYEKCGYPVEHVNYDRLVGENIVARRVYGPLFDNLPPHAISPTDTAIILRKPVVGGKKRKSRKHNPKKRSKTRRH